jgi:hypothetical protein
MTKSLQLTAPENLFAPGGLFACPDCQHSCSNFAERCPQCGRFFQTFEQGQIQVRPGDGWSMAVFWGIMLAWIIPMILGIALIVLLVVIGGIGAASLAPRSPSQTPSSRQ